MQCIAKACPNHDNVILSFVLSRSFFFPFSEYIPKFACSRYCFYHFGHSSCFINHLLENRYAESGRERVRERPFYFNGGGGGGGERHFPRKKSRPHFFPRQGKFY